MEPASAAASYARPTSGRHTYHGRGGGGEIEATFFFPSKNVLSHPMPGRADRAHRHHLCVHARLKAATSYSRRTPLASDPDKSNLGVLCRIPPARTEWVGGVPGPGGSAGALRGGSKRGALLSRWAFSSAGLFRSGTSEAPPWRADYGCLEGGAGSGRNVANEPSLPGSAAGIPLSMCAPREEAWTTSRLSCHCFIPLGSHVFNELLAPRWSSNEAPRSRRVPKPRHG